MKSRKSLWAALALPFVLMAAVAIHPAPTPAPKTLEEEATANCIRQVRPLREIVKDARWAGTTTEFLESLEFAGCIGREEAVLEEEVRRHLRPAFAPEKPQKIEQTPEQLRCPPSYWMTGSGCEKLITAGPLSASDR